jgi:hypothetical protein
MVCCSNGKGCRRSLWIKMDHVFDKIYIMANLINSSKFTDMLLSGLPFPVIMTRLHFSLTERDIFSLNLFIHSWGVVEILFL